MGRRIHLLSACLLAATGLFLQQGAARNLPREATLPVAIRESTRTISAEVPATTATVADALLALRINIADALSVPAPETPLVPGMVITILPARTVRFSDGAMTPRLITTLSADVGGAVASLGETLGPLDRIEPNPNLPLRDGMAIHISRIREEKRTEIVALPFPVRIREENNLPYGVERIVTKGREGRAEEVVVVREEDGRRVARTVLKRSIIEEPTPEERVRGTKIVIGRTIEGKSSWYRFRGGDFAASTIFPFGTWLRVTNLSNGKEIIVRVNDYGPTVPDRVIDLDASAFRKLAPLSKGIIPVRVEEIVSE